MSQQGAVRPWAVGLANRLHLQTFPLHANQILTTAGIYYGLYSVVSPAVSRWLAPKTYKHLSKSSRANWDARAVGFAQAIFISYHALNVIFTDPTRPNATAHQRLWDYSARVGKVQAYAAGYFLWDLYVTSRYAGQFGPSAAAHAFCGLLITMIGFRPFANYYGVNFILYDLSTPFLNIHWLLDKLHLTGSNLQLYNGIALISTFFSARLVWGSYQTWLLSSDMLEAWQTEPEIVPTWLFLTYLVSNTTLTCLNFYWFGKMIQALRKRFEPPKDGDQPARK
ncbi:hypothetical protein LTR86_008110 [Recurvomyces mirabilis]|nr:hypothetical protein LTR86_008110 [Recurvomyces mirabilis]